MNNALQSSQLLTGNNIHVNYNTEIFETGKKAHVQVLLFLCVHVAESWARQVGKCGDSGVPESEKLWPSTILTPSAFAASRGLNQRLKYRLLVEKGWLRFLTTAYLTSQQW